MTTMQDSSVNLDINASFQASGKGSRQNSARKKQSKSPQKKVFFEANVSSPGKPTKETPDARHKRAAFQHQKSYEHREALLRQNSKINEEDISEYKKTEIIRKSIADVKKRAAAAEYIRKSPEKVYAHVKSRIAGNMKSLKKGKKVARKIQSNIDNQVAYKSGTALQREQIPNSYRPQSASPNKKSKNPSMQMSPERHEMIREQEEKLQNVQAEMEALRSQHASVFKPNPGNHAGSVRDFTGTSFTSSPGKQPKY